MMSIDMEPETALLAPLWERLDQMASGARITLALDPEPLADRDPGKIHPVAQARRDAFHFDIAFVYPDRIGQQVKAELESFLARLQSHPDVKGHFAIALHGVSIRLEVSNLVRWNDKRIWVLDGKVMEGCYEDMKGIRVRAWGLDQEQQFAADSEAAQAALEACHAEELVEALQILVEAVRMDLGLFPDQPHKKSALGRAESVLAKLDDKP
jgi:hypothetical protein